MVSVNLYSENSREITSFLEAFYNVSFNINNSLNWKHDFNNPIELAEIIGVFIDNFDEFNLTMWISLDKGLYIHITEENANDIIKYLYERYPY